MCVSLSHLRHSRLFCNTRCISLSTAPVHRAVWIPALLPIVDYARSKDDAIAMWKTLSTTPTLKHLQERTFDRNLSAVLVSKEASSAELWKRDTASRLLVRSGTLWAMEEPSDFSFNLKFPLDVTTWEVMFRMRAPAALRTVPNHPSATSQPVIVSGLIESWHRSEYLQKISSTLEAQTTLINPLGLVSKLRPDGSMKHRLIVDFRASGLNALIGPPPTFALPTIWDALSVLPYGAFLAKVDLKDCFLQFRVSAACRLMLGIRCPLTDQLFQFSRIPFGINFGPVLCQSVTSSIVEEATRRIRLKDPLDKQTHYVVYMDDFLVIGPTSESCQGYLNTLLDVIAEAHMVLAAEKTIQPTRVLEFVGITIDLSNPDTPFLTLAAGKQNSVVKSLESWLVRRVPKGAQVLFSEFQSLIGKLGWFCNLIPQGRCFLSSSWDLIAHTDPSNHGGFTVDFSLTVVRDLMWWLNILWTTQLQRPLYPHPSSRYSIIPPITPTIATFDASLVKYGGTILGQRVDGYWTKQFLDGIKGRQSAKINTLEIRAAVLVVRSALPNLSRHVILLSGDSATAVAYLNLQGRRWTDHSHLVDTASEMKRLEVSYGFTVIAVHTPSKENAFADRLSRDKDVSASVRVLKSDLYVHIDHLYGPLDTDLSLVPEGVLQRVANNLAILRHRPMKCFAIVDSSEVVKATALRKLASVAPSLIVFCLVRSNNVTDIESVLAPCRPLIQFPPSSSLFVQRDPISHDFICLSAVDEQTTTWKLVILSYAQSQ